MVYPTLIAVTAHCGPTWDCCSKQSRPPGRWRATLLIVWCYTGEGGTATLFSLFRTSLCETKAVCKRGTVQLQVARTRDIPRAKQHRNTGGWVFTVCVTHPVLSPVAFYGIIACYHVLYHENRCHAYSHRYRIKLNSPKPALSRKPSIVGTHAN